MLPSLLGEQGQPASWVLTGKGLTMLHLHPFLSLRILSKGLKLLILLPTINIIYLLHVLARKLNFYTSRLAKILRPVNFPHDLIWLILDSAQPHSSSVWSSLTHSLPPHPAPLPLLSFLAPPAFGSPSSVAAVDHCDPLSIDSCRLFTGSFLPWLKLDLSKDTTFPHGPLTVFKWKLPVSAPPLVLPSSWESLIFLWVSQRIP